MVTTYTGESIFVDGNGTYDRGPSAVAALPDDGYVVVWSGLATDSDVNIYMQRYDGAGEPIGERTLVNTTTDGKQATPDVTVLADGGFVVTWNDNDTSYNGDARFQLYDVNGAAIGSETVVNNLDGSVRGQPHMVALDGGGFSIAWTGTDAAHIQHYDASGQEVGTEAALSIGSQNISTVVHYDGGMVVVIQDYYATYLQRIDANGTLVGEKTLVATEQAGVSNLADGGFVFAWVDYNQHRLMTQRYDAHGIATGGAVVVATELYGGGYETSVVAMKDGGYVVATLNGTIALRYFDAAGNRYGDVQYVSPYDVAFRDVDTALLADGSFVVIFDDLPRYYELFEPALIAMVYYADQTIDAAAPGAHSLTGGRGSDTISGFDGDDTLNGGDGPGRDSMDGGDGNDTLVLMYEDTAIGGTGDDLFLAQSRNFAIDGGAGDDLVLVGLGGSFSIDGGAGYDIVDATLSTYGTDIAFSRQIEEFRGSAFDDRFAAGGPGTSLRAFGGAGDDQLIGSEMADTLDGGAGNDTLKGGLGDDVMTGGAGNDVYTVDSGGDQIFEGADGGNDTVVTGINSYVLIAIIENLRLEGATAILGFGNALDNHVWGSEVGNGLDGGLGADTMAGGFGNDTYFVDNIGDVVIEDADNPYYGNRSGIDTVGASIAYTLGANVENLTLIGSADLDGTGNELGNMLAGNSGINHLAGKVGDDTYVLDATGDTVVETAGEGTDTVMAGVSYALDANVENLTLTGTGNINGTGNDLGNMLTGNAGANVLSGMGGNDTYVVYRNDTVVEAIVGGVDTVHALQSYALGANVENLTLIGGNINGTGNELANVLTDSSGKNILTGLGGDDTYYVHNGDDTIVEQAGQGVDTVYAFADFVMGANVENGYALGGAGLTGNALANLLTGSSDRNALYGAGGNDTLDGMGGADYLIGGAGDDVYVVDESGDMVTELVGEGVDTVLAGANYVLKANLENLTLTGTVHINGNGNGLNNLITGNAGNNRIDGNTGNDTMVGGAGNDSYFVREAGDIVREQTGEGNDSVYADMSYNLGSQHVENLVLNGISNLNATGNSLANTLVGNAGNNVLNGGAAADNMYGGEGNDTYYVDNIADRTYETATSLFDTSGHDVVYAGVRVVLDFRIDDLIITGTANLAGTGNDLDNRMTGNSGNNILLGKGGNDVMDGGLGADIMAGGQGDDIYYIDNVGDQARELSGQGNDTVYSSVTFNAGNQYLETITLTGTDDILLSGNAINQILTGNAGANRISGLEGDDIINGGAGNDGLSGGLGADLFVFSVGSGVDRIDFKAADNDLIDIHAYTNGVVNGAGVTISQSGAHAVIDLGGGNLVVALNTTATDAGLLSHIVW